MFVLAHFPVKALLSARDCAMKSFKQESRTAKWWTCHKLWPLMTFDLRKMRRHYATNKPNVSPICMPSFIHTITIVAEKKCVFRRNSQFFHKLWPLMTFDLCLIRKHYATNKTHVSPACLPSFIHTFTIVAEKRCTFCKNRSFFAQTMAPDHLWPLWEVIKLCIFGKLISHTITGPSYKFLCSIVS